MTRATKEYMTLREQSKMLLELPRGKAPISEITQKISAAIITYLHKNNATTIGGNSKRGIAEGWPI